MVDDFGDERIKIRGDSIEGMKIELMKKSIEASGDKYDISEFDKVKVIVVQLRIGQLNVLRSICVGPNLCVSEILRIKFAISKRFNLLCFISSDNKDFITINDGSVAISC